MSDHVYRVRYDKRLLTASTTSTHVDFQEQIKKLLRSLGAVPLDNQHQAASTESIQAKTLDPTINEPFTLPEGMMEVPIPDSLTGPAVHGETLLMTAVNASELVMTVADPNLQPTQCDEIVLDLAKKIYKKRTGQTVRPEEIMVERVGILAYSICQHCKSGLHGLPYRCHLCGRPFCRSHVSPVKHQCPIATTEANSQCQIKPRVTEEAKPKSRVHHPKITIGRVPCG